MARRIVNRMEKRAEVEAFERRKDDDEEGDEEEEEGDEDEEEGDEEEEEGEAGDEDEEEGEAGDEDDEEAPKKKKKAKPKAPAKPKAKPRARTVKATRMRVMWGVFSNSHQMVASYEYPRRGEADAHAARLTSEKRSTHFVQPVKEPIPEEKEKK
jgi:cobalamin biosynthesis protein CobT